VPASLEVMTCQTLDVHVAVVVLASSGYMHGDSCVPPQQPPPVAHEAPSVGAAIGHGVSPEQPGASHSHPSVPQRQELQP
jgi:hypothetical protein